MRGTRARFATSEIGGGTEAELSAAMLSYISYCGPYTYENGRVVHRADVSLFPNWTGTSIERDARVDGTTLTLAAPPQDFGSRRGVATFRWQRAPSLPASAHRP